MNTALITAATTAIVTIIGAITAMIVALRSHTSVANNAIRVNAAISGSVTQGRDRLLNAAHAMRAALATTTRTMYDGINSDVQAIRALWVPGNLVAGYSSGTFAWTDTEWNLFPLAARVRITPHPGDFTADVADMEAGDFTPQQAAEWVAEMRTRGYARPTIYCSLSRIGEIVAAISALGTGLRLGVHWDLWVADWNGSTAIPYPAAAAKQFASKPNEDISVVFDPLWPHRKSAVTSPPPPPPVNPFSFSITPHLEANMKWVITGVLDQADHFVGTWIDATTGTPTVFRWAAPVNLSVTDPEFHVGEVEFPTTHGTFTVDAIVHSKPILIAKHTF